MLQVIIMKGLPGSGKSTWAKQKVAENPNAYKRISKDDLRDMLDNGVHSNDAEKFILGTRDALIMISLHAGKHVIVDDTNLAAKHEDRIRQIVKGMAEVRIQDFTDVPIETCIARDLNRSRSVGEAVIRRMYNQFLKPDVTPIERIEGLPHAIICDLDGLYAY
jgi:predicted kinase